MSPLDAPVGLAFVIVGVLVLAWFGLAYAASPRQPKPARQWDAHNSIDRRPGRR